jgi:hypothetical protein
VFIFGCSLSAVPPVSQSDLPLPSDEWTTYVVGKMSKNIELDSTDSRVRRGSELVCVVTLLNGTCMYAELAVGPIGVCSRDDVGSSFGRDCIGHSDSVSRGIFKGITPFLNYDSNSHRRLPTTRGG